MATIITRAQWGAKHPSRRPGRFLRSEIVKHTAAGAFPGGTLAVADDTFENEARLLRDIERFHTAPKPKGRGWDAIAYSFLTAPSGRIYEGRGWGQDGTHTQHGRNYTAYALCSLGHGDQQAMTDAEVEANRWLIREGIRVGAIRPSYVVTGHRNYAAKSCPGNLIYPQLHLLRGLVPAAPQPPPQEDDVSEIIWAGPHAYHVFGVHAVHINEAAVATLRKAGVKDREWPGTPETFEDAFVLVWGGGQPSPVVTP